MLDKSFVGLIFSVFNQDSGNANAKVIFHYRWKTIKPYQIIDSLNFQASSNQIQLTCFQSVNPNPEGEQPQLVFYSFYCLKLCESINFCYSDRYERLKVPICIVPSEKLNDHCLDRLLELPKILVSEEEELYKSTLNYSNQDILAKLTNDAG